MLAGHGWALVHMQLAFHSESNTLDVLLRPMTGLELSLEWPGCDWIQNRLHVIRGTRRNAGPCEVKVEGTQHLHDPVSSPVVNSSQAAGSAAGLDDGHGRPEWKPIPQASARLSATLIAPDSSTSARPLSDVRAKSDGDLIPGPKPSVDRNNYTGSVATPTRPRLIASARRPRYFHSEQPRVASVATSSVSSIGGEYFSRFQLLLVDFLGEIFRCKFLSRDDLF